MEVHIFRAADRVFGVTQDRTGANLPSQFGAWSPFKALTLVRGELQPGVDVDECIRDIEEFGFHITDAHKRITDQVL